MRGDTQEIPGTYGLLATTVNRLRRRLGFTSLAPVDTTGHLAVPAISGAPTAPPELLVGTVPVAIDPTAKKLWAYCNGAWVSTTLA